LGAVRGNEVRAEEWLAVYRPSWNLLGGGQKTSLYFSLNLLACTYHINRSSAHELSPPRSCRPRKIVPTCPFQITKPGRHAHVRVGRRSSHHQPKLKMPRTPILDLPRKEIVCALAQAGCSGRWIAAYLGCDESTLRYALEKDESFHLRYEQARAAMLIDHLTHISRAAARSWRASAWLLERLFPQEFNLRNSSTKHDLPVEDPIYQPEASASPDADINKPEAQAKDDPSQKPPATDHDPPTPDPDPPMDHDSFDPKSLWQAVVERGLTNAPFARPRTPGTILGPDGYEYLPPRNHNPIREKIMNEGLTGLEIDRLLQEEFLKEQARYEMAKVYGVPVSEVPPIDISDVPPPG
jgi:hypothetical protein